MVQRRRVAAVGADAVGDVDVGVGAAAAVAARGLPRDRVEDDEEAVAGSSQRSTRLISGWWADAAGGEGQEADGEGQHQRCGSADAVAGPRRGEGTGRCTGVSWCRAHARRPDRSAAKFPSGVSARPVPADWRLLWRTGAGFALAPRRPKRPISRRISAPLTATPRGATGQRTHAAWPTAKSNGSAERRGLASLTSTLTRSVTELTETWSEPAAPSDHHAACWWTRRCGTSARDVPPGTCVSGDVTPISAGRARRRRRRRR